MLHKSIHAKAFFFVAVDQAIADGQTFREFRKNLSPTLKKKEWWGMKKGVNLETRKLTGQKKYQAVMIKKKSKMKHIREHGIDLEDMRMVQEILDDGMIIESAADKTERQFFLKKGEGLLRLPVPQKKGRVVGGYPVYLSRNRSQDRKTFAIPEIKEREGKDTAGGELQAGGPPGEVDAACRGHGRGPQGEGLRARAPHTPENRHPRFLEDIFSFLFFPLMGPDGGIILVAWCVAERPYDC